MLKRLLWWRRKPKERYSVAAEAIVAMNVPEVGQVLAQRFYELKKKCRSFNPPK